MPETVFEFNRSYLFGLFYFSILTEDRKPPLDSYYKYKTLINVRFFWFRFSYIVKSINPGLYYHNGKSLDIVEQKIN